MLILYIDNYQYEVNEMRLADVSLICKALGDSNRLEIVQMLSNGENFLSSYLQFLQVLTGFPL